MSDKNKMTTDDLNVGTKIKIVFQTSGAKRFVFPVQHGIDRNFDSVAFAFNEEHAGFIVRACKSYDAMVEALFLQEVLHRPNSPERTKIMEDAGYVANDPYDAEYTMTDFVRDKCADALELAEGEQK